MGRMEDKDVDQDYDGSEIEEMGDLEIARFASEQTMCHPDIHLTCGGHCAVKLRGTLYRTVRASMNIPLSVAIYFEISISQYASAAPRLAQQRKQRDKSNHQRRG